MNDFVLVWVLMFFDATHGALTYSPPVKSIEDCQRMATMISEYWADRPTNVKRIKCVQINMLKKASEK
jgi:hypothetical protein